MTGGYLTNAQLLTDLVGEAQVAQTLERWDQLDTARHQPIGAIPLTAKTRRWPAPPGLRGRTTGVGQWTAENLIAEVGVDLSRFPTAAHLDWTVFCRLSKRELVVHCYRQVLFGERIDDRPSM